MMELGKGCRGSTLSRLESNMFVHLSLSLFPGSKLK